MKITFLGTGTSQGVPVVACDCKVCKSEDQRDKRLRSSILLEEGSQVLAVDAGPDFRQQMLRENVKRLDGILITHEHKDHLGGLDDVRAFNFIQKKAVDVYARKEIHAEVIREFGYAFTDQKYPGVPDISLHDVNGQPFSIDGLEIIPVEALHYRLPVFGYRIGDFAYLTDLSELTDIEKSKLTGLKVVVLAALRKKAHISHMNLQQAIDLVDEIRPEKAYLTHLSHLMGCHADVEKELPENIRLAYDGLKLDI